MTKAFSRTLFGFKPEEVINQMGIMDVEYQEKVSALQSEIEMVKSEIKEYEEQAKQLQEKLNEYKEREHVISSVMIIAQKNAQKVEDEAREKAREMIDKADAEVDKKLRELESLRIKIGAFKEEFLRALESYKISVEAIKEPDVGTRETNFTPTLVVSERQRA
ncbi:MAG: hypothetical protein VR68_03135 [Peptococcaceae bacterium BRH_c4a]|nr:MAG: hypothetical protein VR68_03135 [Peptococcaceae bacterium BRH_c4a]